jgi:membrane protein implicated in regulation of membrane protease activity
MRNLHRFVEMKRTGAKRKNPLLPDHETEPLLHLISICVSGLGLPSLTDALALLYCKHPFTLVNHTKCKGTEMSKDWWSSRIILKYALLQLPALVLLVLILLAATQGFGIPAPYGWGIIALWIIKDILLYPFVYRAYDTDPLKTAHTLVGKRGVAQERIAPAGYVQIGGELWGAEVPEGKPPIDRGEKVEVLGIRGLTLLVGPTSPPSRPTPPEGSFSPRPPEGKGSG